MEGLKKILRKVVNLNQFQQNPLLKSLMVFLLIPILPVLLITIFIPMFITRSLVKYLAKKFRPDLAEMVTPASNNMANSSPDPQKPRLAILITHTYRGKISLETAKQTISKLVSATDSYSKLRFPECSQYVTSYMGFRFWAHDTNFYISNHVKPLRHIKPVMSQDDIRDAQQDLLAKPFHPKHSPWDVTIIHNVSANSNSFSTSGLNTVLIYRFAHIIGDGYSLIKATESFAEITKEVQINPKFSSVNKSKLDKIAFPFQCLYATAEMILSCFKNSPFKVQHSKRTYKDHVESADVISVNVIKEIKNACNVSFTSVVISLAAGAYRSLAIRGGMILPETISCLIPVPLSGHPSNLRNHFTLASMNLPVGEPDAIQRLQICHEEYERIKTSAFPTVGYLGIIGFGASFNFIGQLGVKHHPGDLFISYLPLEWADFYFAGHELLSHSFCSAQSGYRGCGTSISTFRDQLNVTVVAESGIFKKGQTSEFRNIIKDEIEVLNNIMERYVKHD